MTPDRIMRDLHALWRTLGKEQGEAGHGTLRACTMTLYVLADEADDPAAIWELLAALMPGHPSRAILARVRRGTERVVDARVFAQCWLPFGQRRQICCEQIEVAATDASVEDLPPLLLPLAAADLPVMLYCRCPRLFASPHVEVLAGGSAKVIVDSALYGDAAGALAVLAARTGPPAVADLAWTRLTPWRAAVAEIFEDPALRERLASAEQVHLSASLSVEAYYLAAWLLDGIARVGASAQARIDPAVEGVRGLAIRGPGLDIAIGTGDTGSAEIRTPGAVRRAALPNPPPYAPLGEELGLTGEDPVYARILPAAARLAHSLAG